MKKVFLVILTCLVVQLFNCSIFAQEEIDIGEVLITGTKIEESIKKLPFSANVITKEEILKRPILRSEELVKQIPGVQSIASPVGTHGVFVTMRGGGLGKQVISLDGQPINDGFNGYVRLGVIPSKLMEKVEVIRGPFSALYGPYGMAGVINFLPKKDVDENEIKIQSGSFGTYSYSLMYGKESDKSNLALFIEEKNIDGYIGDFVVLEPRTTQPTGTIREVAGFEKTSTVDGKVAYKIGHRGKNYSKEHRNYYLSLSHTFNTREDILLTYLYGRQKHGLDGGTSSLSSVGDGTLVNSGNVKFTDDGVTYYLTISPVNFLPELEGRCGQDILSVKYTNKIKDNFKLKVFGGLNTRVQKWAAPLSGATVEKGPGRKGTPEGVSKRIGIETEIKSDKDTLISGFELTLNSGGSKRERLSNWKDINSVTALEEEAKGKSRISSLYLMRKLSLLEDKLSFVFGGRYDNWKNYDGMTITPSTITTFPNKNISRLNPKLGILYKIREDLSAKVSYGEGFRMPGPHELYRQMITTSVSLGNPNLTPEVNKCFEIAFDFFPNQKNIKSIKATLYNDKTNDLIYIRRWRAPHPDTGVMADYSMRENAGKSKTTGYEIEIDSKTITLAQGIKLSWFANCSITNPKITKNLANPITVGKVIPYVPKHMYNFGLSVEKEPFTFYLGMHKRGKIYTRDDNTDTVNNVRGSIDPFTTFDTKIGWNITKKDIFSIAINNIFDKKYYGQHDQLAPGRNITAEYSTKF